MSENGKAKFIGVLVKPEILGDRTLTPAEKLVLAYLISQGECRETNAQIAERLGVSVPTLSRAISRLSHRGLITTEYGRGK